MLRVAGELGWNEVIEAYIPQDSGLLDSGLIECSDLAMYMNP